MDFQFNDEQQELRAMARAFLAEHSGSEQIREAMDSDLGYAPSIWKQIAVELGWAAVTVPEEYGGLGLGPVELTALLETTGESLLCAPYFSSVCLGANALLVAGNEAQKQEHLPGIAAGETIATLAQTSVGGSWAAEGIETRCSRDGSDYVLDGTACFVLDAHCAGLLVVAARAEGSAGREGISLFCVPAATDGLTITPQTTMDQTRRLSTIELSGVRVAAEARLGDEGAAWPLLREILDRAAIALAAEQTGVAQRCLDMAVAYANEREQFGRPIGSFQAIKHKCADMMVALESARSAAYYAACVAADAGDSGDDLSTIASLAKSWCSDTVFRCAADSLQIHGGVGFTWEYDVHLYFKRARSSEIYLGDPAYHRERVARRIGLA
jgi:alkylation response protein AidB-like acyl-CoA dehydrogenase